MVFYSGSLSMAKHEFNRSRTELPRLASSVECFSLYRAQIFSISLSSVHLERAIPEVAAACNDIDVNFIHTVVACSLRIHITIVKLWPHATHVWAQSNIFFEHSIDKYDLVISMSPVC